MPKKLSKDTKHLEMPRTCISCGVTITTTASGLKKHFRACTK